MAATPILKVYSPKGEYVASCKYLTDAAILVGYYGSGAIVRKGHNGKVLWREGYEDDLASNSADHAAEVMQANWN